MGTYRLTEDAKADLIRIYQRGLLEFGEAQADDYHNAFFASNIYERDLKNLSRIMDLEKRGLPG